MAAFSVVNNIASANAQANLINTSNGLTRTLNRLSSGLRINYSGDDAAGLAVANGYRSDVAILGQGIRNANDGLSSLQIKDGALNNISLLLDRLATLATQSASAGFMGDRTTLEAEFTATVAEISREAGVAGMTASATFSVFLSSGSTVTGTIGAADATGLGIGAATIATAAGAATAVTTVKTGHRHARHGAGLGRHAREPAAVRGQPGSDPGGEHQGGREPDPRRERGGGIGEHDPVQHPEPGRHRGPRPGELLEQPGSRAAPVVRRVWPGLRMCSSAGGPSWSACPGTSAIFRPDDRPTRRRTGRAAGRPTPPRGGRRHA